MSAVMTDLLARIHGRDLMLGVSLVCAVMLLLRGDRGSRRWLGAGALAVLGLVLFVGGPPPAIAALAVALLLLDPRDALQSECAAKLLWTLGPAVALAACGNLLLVAATGADRPLEQWGVLALGLEARFLWSSALGLSLLLGPVLLGAPPFHFWVADLLQGGRAWLGPLTIVALQCAGASWLDARLADIASFEAGADAAQAVLRVSVAAGLLAGAFTLWVQRRPERRVGTLASLQGALLIAGFAQGAPPEAGWVARWTAHLAVAMMGAATLSRFLPVATGLDTPPGAMARHHSLSTLAGLVSWFSLAGLPGTPGSLLWLEVAHGLMRAGLSGLLIALAVAWLVALGACFQQARETFGLALTPSASEGRPPGEVRLVLWLAAAAVVGLVLLPLRWS
jgi:NADH:ubiquinone oxidoreductase subunit 2 (subunit N)